jgi:hypothetical protein
MAATGRFGRDLSRPGLTLSPGISLARLHHFQSRNIQGVEPVDNHLAVGWFDVNGENVQTIMI